MGYTGIMMNEDELERFRGLANAMRGSEPNDWQWIGEHMSQRMFGITERRAKDYADRFGGTASPMEPPDPDVAYDRRRNED